MSLLEKTKSSASTRQRYHRRRIWTNKAMGWATRFLLCAGLIGTVTGIGYLMCLIVSSK